MVTRLGWKFGGGGHVGDLGRVMVWVNWDGDRNTTLRTIIANFEDTENVSGLERKVFKISFCNRIDDIVLL